MSSSPRPDAIDPKAIGPQADRSKANGPDAIGPETIALAQQVLEIETRGLRQIAPLLETDSFREALALLFSAKGRVQVSGMGKSGIVGRRVASSFRSTGTPAVFLHPTEAVHGDLGLVEPGDVGLFFSKSGESEELLRLVPTFARMKLPIIAVVSRQNNALAREASVVLELGPIEEAGPIKLIPTTSTTLFQVLGDILVTCLYSLRGVTEAELSFLHPGGLIGRQATVTVGEVMARGTDLPRVEESTPLREALVEMIEKRLGLTTVVDAEGRLSGLVTDGDIRRAVFDHSSIEDLSARDVMTRNPRTIEKSALLAAAVARMESNEPRPITSLVIADAEGRPEGVIHLHDCLGAGAPRARKG